MSFGLELRNARLAAGLSLAELARQVHFTKGYLSKVENGIARPNHSLAALCDAALGTEGRLTALIPKSRRRSRAGTAPGRVFGLPAATAHFSDRTEELSKLCAFLGTDDDSPGPHTRIYVIHGMAGVGKTALAVRAALRMEGHFADGSLFLDLRGYQHDADPVTPAAVLDRLLHLLGVDGDTIPRAIDDRAARYRDVLRGRRFLLLFDNVRDVEQILPLLPAEPCCRVLITSRSRLIALDDARHLSLDTLDGENAQLLFRSVAGLDRLAAEPAESVRDIVERLGRLPLAVRIAAARFRGNPTWTLEHLRELLADHGELLEELDDRERSVAAAFRLSYDGLPEQHRQLFGELAMHPGADLDIRAAAALAGSTVREAERSIDPLLDAHLIAQPAPGRYRFHDLIRVFAAGITASDLPAEIRRSAVDRLIDHYVAAADLADRQITPHRNRKPLGIDETPPSVPEFGGPEAARAWVDNELANLVSVSRLARSSGRHQRCWQIALVLGGYFFLTRAWEAWTETHELGLGAAIAAGDRWAEGALRNRLGLLHIELGDLETASAHYQRALTVFRELDDEPGAMTALANDAWVHHYRGNHQRALRDLEIAYDSYMRAGHRRNAAITLRGIGLIAAEAGDVPRAISDLERSLEEFNELDLPLDAAMALNNLGRVYQQVAEYTRAAGHYEQAIVLSETAGSRFEQARAEAGLGSVSAANDQVGAARAYWTRALAHYRALRAPQAADVERHLSDLDG